MVKRTIIWSKQADYELKNTLIFHNLRNGNTKYSLRLLDQIKQITDALSEKEFIGRLSGRQENPCYRNEGLSDLL